jgi:hypothetical protein
MLGGGVEMNKKLLFVNTLLSIVFVLFSLVMIFGEINNSVIFLEVLYNLLFVSIFVLSLYLIIKNKWRLKEKAVWLSIIFLVFCFAIRISLAISYVINMSSFD